MARVRSRARRPASAQGEGGPTSGELVLIVDDDPNMLQVMQDILQTKGYRVITALDGPSALEMLQRHSPDVVLLDIMMPEMDGFSVCQRMREVSQVPIIVVSGLAGRHLAVREPVAVFDKPIDPDEFLEAVNKALG